MNEWMPIWTTALGGLIALVSGFVTPAFIEWRRAMRSEFSKQMEARREVGNVLSEFISIRRSQSVKISEHRRRALEHGERVIDLGGDLQEMVIAERVRLFVAFDAPDVKKEVEELIDKTGEQFSSLMNAYFKTVTKKIDGEPITPQDFTNEVELVQSMMDREREIGRLHQNVIDLLSEK